MWVDRDVLFANLSAPASHVLERELARRPAAGANCHLVAGGARRHEQWRALFAQVVLGDEAA